jgi:hypothetical protein
MGKPVGRLQTGLKKFCATSSRARSRSAATGGVGPNWRTLGTLEQREETAFGIIRIEPVRVVESFRHGVACRPDGLYDRGRAPDCSRGRG